VPSRSVHFNHRNALLPPTLATPFSEFKDDNHAGEEERDRLQEIAQIQKS
jgi:hypothetical protein